jgi:hypothetical protein
MGLNPWDRQESETASSFAAFVIYRDLEPHQRSYKEVAKLDPAGRAPATIKTLLSTHSWVDRAAAYDDHLDKQRQRTTAKMREDQDRATLSIASYGLANLATAIQEMDISQLAKPQYFPRVLDVIVKVSHLATGSKAAGELKPGQSVEDEIRKLNEEMDSRATKESK